MIGSFMQGNIDHRILHIRLTDSCNADCSYCSSYNDKPTYMSAEQVLSSVSFIKDEFYKKRYPIKGNGYISVQYIGGEVLTVQPDVLEKIVKSVEVELSDIFYSVRSGVQSNLIGSGKRLDSLIKIFGKNIGTSEEFSTSERTINGSSEVYKNLYNKGIKKLKVNGVVPGVIFTLSKDSVKESLSFYNASQAKYHSITYRPIFEGGKEVSGLSNDELYFSLRSVLYKWVLSGNIHVEPFSMLLSNLLNNIEFKSSCAGCPFQSDCVEKSLDIEANGDIYICLDTADAGNLKIGNAINGHIDDALLFRLGLRKNKIIEQCSGCKAFKVCHGGCLAESVSKNNNIYSKTPYCDVWLRLVSDMENIINEFGFDNVKSWFDSL